MKSILVATDFSKNAYCALFYAAILYSDEPSNFILLHSLKAEVAHLTFPLITKSAKKRIEIIKKEANYKLKEIKHKLIGDLEKTKHTLENETSLLELPQAINKICKEKNIDLVVMGSRGQTPNNSVFIGRNSFDVIKTIYNTPLLIVPDEIEFVEPKKISLATGFKIGLQISNLTPLIDITTRTGADVSIIHIREKEKLSEKQKANFKDLKQILRFVDAEMYWIPEDKNKYTSIMAYLEKEKIDILVMSYSKHSLIQSIWHDCAIETISWNIKIPYLLLPHLD